MKVLLLLFMEWGQSLVGFAVLAASGWMPGLSAYQRMIACAVGLVVCATAKLHRQED